MKPLYTYLIAVIIVWAVILTASWFIGGPEKFKLFSSVCAGFFLGMLAMYIAVHVYSY